MPSKPKNPTLSPTLDWYERVYHRDQLRAGRYAALADAEGFHAICFALEALGMRLLGRKATLGTYKPKLLDLSLGSVVLSEQSMKYPGMFSKFSPLFELVLSARNDAMHTGVYARHATAAAIELCIGLEEALMKHHEDRKLVEDFMVKTPVTVEDWQPIARARQLMLTHSFSFLPVLRDEKWQLISEGALARYMRSSKGKWSELLSATVKHASSNGLVLIDAKVVPLEQDVVELLAEEGEENVARLWLVKDDNGHLCGVLSPYELM